MRRIVGEILFWSGPAVALLTMVIFQAHPYGIHLQESWIIGLILIGFGLLVIGSLMLIFQRPKKERDKS